MSTNPVTGKKQARASVALPYWINEFLSLIHISEPTRPY